MNAACRGNLCLVDLVVHMRSHYADAGGNLEGFLVGSEGHVGLLLAIGTDERVHSGDLDLVQVLAGTLDHGLLGLTIADEHERVVLFNGFDGTLAAKRVLDDGIRVKCLGLLDTSPNGDCVAFLSLGHGTSEGNLSPHFALGGLMLTFLHISCCFFRLQI